MSYTHKEVIKEKTREKLLIWTIEEFSGMRTDQ
jgi:hypothetical protein